MGGVADAVGDYVESSGESILFVAGSMKLIFDSADPVGPAADKIRDGDLEGAVQELGAGTKRLFERVQMLTGVESADRDDVVVPAPRHDSSECPTEELAADRETVESALEGASGSPQVEAARDAFVVAERVLDG